jgi:hypothetical protein
MIHRESRLITVGQTKWVMFGVQPATKVQCLERSVLEGNLFGGLVWTWLVCRVPYYFSDWMMLTFKRLFPRLVPLAINQE